MRFVLPWLLAVSATVAWVTGCSNGSSVPISDGVVTLDGRPLPNVIVDLVPVDPTALPINGAASDDAGRFRLRSRGRGRYTVVVTEGESGADSSRVPMPYRNPQTSPLQVELPLEVPMALTLERE